MDHDTMANIERVAKEMFAAPEPFGLLAKWMAEAETSEPNDHIAMSIATVDAQGMPNARVVLAKQVDAEGFVFYTNFNSAKGEELKATPKAALCFHWKSLFRQIRARGQIEIVSDQQADDYFASRPRESRIGAWASDQSEEMATRKLFDDRYSQIEQQYAGRDVPRPPNWSGFRLVPLEIEFWQSQPARLHDRAVFRRDDTGAPWRKLRLFP
jgi:pyridoxamine 5'-phosphate oxidase